MPLQLLYNKDTNRDNKLGNKNKKRMKQLLRYSKSIDRN